MHVGVQVQGWFDVVVGHHGRALYPGDGCHAAENLRLPIGTGHWQRFQGRQAVEAVLRGGGDDGVRHAVGRVEPEGRRGLRAAGEGGDHAVGDVTLGDA